MSNRARVIYQSEALYAGTVDATGHHWSATTDNGTTFTSYATKDAAEASGGTVRNEIHQLRRVQSANYSFTVNRQDVNQFGQLARVDSVAIDPPTVTLDLSYYLTNGVNESILGFDVAGNNSALAGDVCLGTPTEDPSIAGKNFFILTTPEGKDAVGHDLTTDPDSKSVIALGNGFVSNYSVEAAVGAMPTANVTVDGLNLRSYTGTDKKPLPSVDIQQGTPIEGLDFSIPPAVTGLAGGDEGFGAEGVACLRPGDITLKLGAGGAAGEFEQLPDGTTATEGTAHIQSVSIDVPMSRTPIQRLGNPYGFTRVTDLPINISITVSAIMSDLKEGNVADLLFDNDKHDLEVTLKEPKKGGGGDTAIKFTVKGAQLDGESFSSSIGDNKTVDLTFTAQVGGPEDKTNGLFILGSDNALTLLS